MVVNNPNNWHWVDKNCIDWSRNYFNKELVGVSAKVEDGREVAVKSVSSVEGDVEVCQRKGKVISLFDLKLTLNLTGYASANNEGEFSGSIIIPELAYDSTADDLQFDISIYNENAESEKMKAVIKQKLLPQLRLILAKFGDNLITTHSSDIQLDSDLVNSNFTKENQNSLAKAALSSKPSSTQSSSSSAVKPKSAPKPVVSNNVPKYNTSTLHLEPTFNTTAEQLYITLLEKDRIAAWTRSHPQIDEKPKEGSSFKLFGGSISGKFTKLIPNERIVQLWRLEDWRDGHYAELDIQLIQGAGETKMVVKWSGIPIGEEDRVRGNFEDYYIRSIKITFGFGAVL